MFFRKNLPFIRKNRPPEQRTAEDFRLTGELFRQGINQSDNIFHKCESFFGIGSAVAVEVNRSELGFRECFLAEYGFIHGDNIQNVYLPVAVVVTVVVAEVVSLETGTVCGSDARIFSSIVPVPVSPVI